LVQASKDALSYAKGMSIFFDSACVFGDIVYDQWEVGASAARGACSAEEVMIVAKRRGSALSTTEMCWLTHSGHTKMKYLEEKTAHTKRDAISYRPIAQHACVQTGCSWATDLHSTDLHGITTPGN
jgi:hypothetical protein